MKGFTLIELAIVVAILLIIALVAYPSYTRSVLTANRQDAITKLYQIQTQFEQYYNTNNTYPNSINAAYGTLQIPSSIYYNFFGGIGPSQCAAAAGINCPYVITAIPTGRQMSDTSCQEIDICLGAGEPKRAACDMAGHNSTSVCWGTTQ